MAKVWEHAFTNEMRTDPSEHNVLLTEAPGNPRANREKMVELMFDTFQVQGLYVAIQAVLSLYANGRTTGIVCDSGDGVTHTVPVYEGFCIPHAVKKNFIAGRAITSHLNELLIKDNIADPSSGASTAWKQIVRTIKEDCCYVALDPIAEREKAANSAMLVKDYELPDGQTVQINTPRFMAPEALFYPDLIREGDETLGMHKMVFESVKECDIDIRKELYGNIILSGGSSLYNGLPDRLLNEVDALCP